MPLLVVSSKDSFQIRDDLLSHLDLPKIVYQYIASEKRPSSRDSMFFVGSTEKWVYGKMNKEKEYLFLDNTSGTILGQNGSMDPIKVRDEFQHYLDIFNSKYGKK